MNIQNTYIFSLLFLAVLIITPSCKNSTNQSIKGEAKAKFNHTEFDFGTVKMGEKLLHDFIFTNIGKGDLYIKGVDTDCGCTAVKFDEKAIKPAEQSIIEVMFDTQGFPGFQTKKINVLTNTNDTVILTLSAVVDFELIKNN